MSRPHPTNEEFVAVVRHEKHGGSPIRPDPLLLQRQPVLRDKITKVDQSNPETLVVSWEPDNWRVVNPNGHYAHLYIVAWVHSRSAWMMWDIEKLRRPGESMGTGSVTATNWEGESAWWGVVSKKLNSPDRDWEPKRGDWLGFFLGGPRREQDHIAPATQRRRHPHWVRFEHGEGEMPPEEPADPVEPVDPPPPEGHEGCVPKAEHERKVAELIRAYEADLAEAVRLARFTDSASLASIRDRFKANVLDPFNRLSFWGKISRASGLVRDAEAYGRELDELIEKMRRNE